MLTRYALSSGAAVAEWTQGGARRCWVTAAADPADRVAIFTDLVPAGFTPVAQFVFGGCRHEAEALARMGEVSWPITWAEGDTCSGEDLAGTHVWCVADVPVTPLELAGRVVGTVFEDADARWCQVGGILPADPGALRPEQARSVFERLETVLAEAEMTLAEITRTWFYLAGLLEWYGEFNQIRTACYESRGLFERRLPASTGIGARNPAGAALVAAAHALRPKRPGVEAPAVPSPLQCPATAYRSSFSRAVEVITPGARQLIVSGTASVAPSGETAHRGDVRKQVELTLEVVEAILASRGMDWPDVARALVYFRDMEDNDAWAAACAERGLPPFPALVAHAVVCRPDLLFELELDAVAGPAAGPPTA